MDERERARARRRRKRRQQKSSVKWPRVILAIVVVFTLLGGIGYGIYSGVSYAYRAIVGTTEATEAVTDSGNKQDANTVSVEQKGLDKPLYILVIGTDDNNPSQGDSLFLLSVNLDQKTMDVIGIPSNSKIDNRDQTDATMLNSIYEKGGIELTKAVVMPIAWIPDLYVNPSNNGNLQSSYAKDLNKAKKRTNATFIEELKKEIQVAEGKKKKRNKKGRSNDLP